MIHGLEGLLPSFDLALKGSKGDSHPHPIVAHLKENDWQEMRECLARVVEILGPLSPRSVAQFKEHLDGLISVAEKISGDEFWEGTGAEELEKLVETLRQESGGFPFAVSSAPAPRSAGICKKFRFGTSETLAHGFPSLVCWKPAWSIRKASFSAG